MLDQFLWEHSSRVCDISCFFSLNITVSNSLDPDQAQHLVVPDLGPTSCKGYQQTTLVGKMLTLLLAGNLFMIFCHRLIFLKIEFSIYFFQKYIFGVKPFGS